MTKMSSKLLLIIILISTGCAQRLKVPINRMMSPETIGKGLEVELDQVGFSFGVFDFSDGDTDNSLFMTTVSERSLHTGIGLVDKMDFFVEIPKESAARVGVKIQLIGTPEKARAAGHKLAMVLTTGNSNDLYELDYVIKMKSNLQEYGLIYGYRFNENLLAYQGLTLTNYEFEGKIRNATDLNSNNLNYEAKNILGVNLGVSLGPPSLKVKLEGGIQNIKWSNTDTKLFYSFGYAVTATW
jgi:hypothetical protein